MSRRGTAPCQSKPTASRRHLGRSVPCIVLAILGCLKHVASMFACRAGFLSKWVKEEPHDLLSLRRSHRPCRLSQCCAKRMHGACKTLRKGIIFNFRTCGIPCVIRTLLMACQELPSCAIRRLNPQQSQHSRTLSLQVSSEPAGRRAAQASDEVLAWM